MTRWLKDNRGFILFILFLGVFRTAIADWNPIPTGSMRPTLLEGDVVLVNRLAYDLKLPLTDIALMPLGTPQRGDVVTFSSPLDGTRLIKRIVGLPGDRIELRSDVLWVNGVAAHYGQSSLHVDTVAPGMSVSAQRTLEDQAGSRRQVQFMPQLPARRDFAAAVVPEGHYFMLGDNRDNSHDSRYIGVVPRALLIGRAHRVLVSADILENWWPRFERTVSAIQ